MVTDKSILDILEADDSPVYSGIKSQLGRRRAYATFLQQQRSLDANAVLITMFILYTNYHCEKSNSKRKMKLHPPSEILTIITEGMTCELSEKYTTFQIEDIVYIRYKKSVVIRVSPYIKYDVLDESSCYSMLLLHNPWPPGGEKNILPEGVTAVQKFHSIEDFPSYVQDLVIKLKHQDSVLALQGEPLSSAADIHEGNELEPSANETSNNSNTAHNDR